MLGVPIFKHFRGIFTIQLKYGEVDYHSSSSKARSEMQPQSDTDRQSMVNVLSPSVQCVNFQDQHLYCIFGNSSCCGYSANKNWHFSCNFRIVP